MDIALFIYIMILFYMVCDVVDPFFFFFFACQKGLSCRMGTPTLCQKNWATNFESEKKCRSPPPPPLLISLFGTCATFDAGGAPKKKCRSPPPPPPHNPLRIGAHGYNDTKKWEVCFSKASTQLLVCMYNHDAKNKITLMLDGF